MVFSSSWIWPGSYFEASAGSRVQRPIGPCGAGPVTAANNRKEGPSIALLFEGANHTAPPILERADLYRYANHSVDRANLWHQSHHLTEQARHLSHHLSK